ncbi:glycosyltransferase family 2 protein [Chlorobaculum sp. MV4-Y]|uniref:glycosyltransferase family 2 protein n=1 Tax=Chlorobaculum sp. MV4-Y TaxID=2976335 RepID=UPI0021AF37D6|nr:glycosyltransferase family 2 protein [Chlorobaculum sp. MV4-Y]UWX57852.1 glycosyltransferase family 2 protein [Chlorobaculum sp. MV4-Y]
MKIVGIVFAKNEWGLIAVSISHALINHVDEVYVVNHASTDQTFNGLNHLKKLWGERLHIITINNIGFFQEEATNTIIQISKKSNPDWIYVFDADEFLLADESTSLKKILSNTEKCCQAIRYTVNNYISTRHFNDLILDNYKDIIYKSVINPDIEKKVNKRSYKRLTKNKTIPELIYDGDATFFDIPFPSKVIIRFSNFLQITAGAHAARHFNGNIQGKHAKEIEAVHLTYPTKKRLLNKAERGKFLIKTNFPQAMAGKINLSTK